MMPDKLLQLLKHEGVVAIATQGGDGPHLVNTWNGYIQIDSVGHMMTPTGYMNKIEENVTEDPRILLTAGAREVDGFNGPDTGSLIKGAAAFLKSGSKFEAIKQKFP